MTADAAEFLRKYTTGTLPGGHFFDRLHRLYNREIDRLIREYIQRYCQATGGRLTKDQAIDFLRSLSDSKSLIVILMRQVVALSKTGIPISMSIIERIGNGSLFLVLNPELFPKPGGKTVCPKGCDPT